MSDVRDEKSAYLGRYTPGAATAHPVRLLAILCGAYVLSFVDRQVLSLMVAPIRHDLRITDLQVSLLQGAAFAIFYSTLGLPIGRLADKYSRTRIIAGGIAVWSVMTVMCGFSRTFSQLFSARVGVGIGEAALSPAAYSLLSDSFAPHRLPRVFSIFAAGVTIGAGFAYILGGFIIETIQAAGPLHLSAGVIIQPWQLVFMAVGTPGLLMALSVLGLKEPVRLASQTSTTLATLSETLSTMKGNWRAYVPIFSAVSLLSIVASGYLNWFPTYLMRDFHWPVRTVGITFGAIYLFFGTSGLIAGALCAELLGRRGHEDAALRTVMCVGLLLIPASLMLFLHTPWIVLSVCAPTVLLLNAHVGVAMASIQLITPNRMRAFVSATLLLTVNLVGQACGSTLVPLISGAISNEQSLGNSIGMIMLVVSPLSAWCAWTGLPHYRAALNRAGLAVPVRHAKT